MQIRLYTGLFIKKCIILTVIALPIILSSNGLASEIIFGERYATSTSDTTKPSSDRLPLLALDTTGQPGDSIRIVYDSTGMPIDTIQNDTTRPKPLFSDLITYNADDSVKFSIGGKKVFLYGNGFVKYLTSELKADYIVLDMEKKEAYATGAPDSVGELKGTPKFKDGAQEFEGKELRYNFDLFQRSSRRKGKDTCRGKPRKR